jgi:hypothetical protein
VNKQGLIVYHSIREFGKKGRSFSGDWCLHSTDRLIKKCRYQ